GQERSDIGVGEVELREAFQGAVERERGRPHVGELVGQGGDWRGEKADGLLDLVAEVDEAFGPRPSLDLAEHGAELGFRKLVHCSLDARGQPCSRQSCLFDWCQHGRQPSSELRLRATADGMGAALMTSRGDEPFGRSLGSAGASIHVGPLRVRRTSAQSPATGPDPRWCLARQGQREAGAKVRSEKGWSDTASAPETLANGRYRPPPRPKASMVRASGATIQ